MKNVDRFIAESCYCAKMRNLSRKVTNIYDDKLRKHGVKSSQLTVVVGASLIGPASVTDLAKNLGMDRTTLTRNLKPLQAAGFVELKQGYGRARNIYITKKGKELLHTAKPSWEQAQKVVKELLGKESTDVINDIYLSVNSSR